MDNAPKSLWIDPDYIEDETDCVSRMKVLDRDVKYIRADLVDGLVEALEKGDYKPYCDCEECKKTRETLKVLEEE